MKIEIRLTPKEAEAIQHRLDIPDAIAQVWGPEGDNIWDLTYERCLQKTEWLINQVVCKLAGGGMILTFRPDNADEVRLMEELVDGNTMGMIVCDLLEHEPGNPHHVAGINWRKCLRQIDTKWANAGLSSRFEI